MPADTDALLTIRDFIRWGASRFDEADLYFGHGTDNALDESAQLVLAALHLAPDLPPMYLDARLTPGEREQVLALLRRRLEERLPAPYLTHKTWFAGIEFYLDERVLVPRSPLAELIEGRFEPWVVADQLDRVLDLCTGGGCIGLATALHLPEVRVDLADISGPALEVARHNLARYRLQDRVETIQSDLFQALAGRRYDLILCNPPYVDAQDLAALPPEYHREPLLGLSGGADGLDLVRQILANAVEFLEPGGTLIVEVGNSAEALMEQFPQVPWVWLEFERGGDGVFLLTREQLQEFHTLFVEASNP